MPGWLWRHRVLAGSNLATLGMGLVMIVPEAYLPTFSQSVQGLRAIAAGMVPASMSIGWPTASAFSGRLYMRIGFRDTALCGAVLLVLAALGFVWIPEPQPVWAVVVDQVALGAGFGLLSTPLLVGEQSVVRWEQPGVVTGGNMFARYLGRSLDAAIFGAVFNAAPAAVRETLPGGVDQVIHALHAAKAGAATDDYLRDSISLATRHLYLGMTVIAVIMLLVLLAVPRRFALATATADARGNGSVG